ncbi:GMC oxidoreductase [Streptomyces erythrochromogenes]|uniref:GMC oxidoreductase n=1 Tax=Streptomyces erythrochromogenes TaxID=285574 RepID=UPI00367FC6FB
MALRFRTNDAEVQGSTGARQRAVDACISPFLARPNPDVVTDATVWRLRITVGRCTGVEYTVGGEHLSAESAEGVVTAGAIGPAHLPMLSAIRPARHRALSAMAPHGSGTARLANTDPSGAPAVDPANLRVRGTAGLRAADASVMPSIPSANPNATVCAIAERAAELLD